MKRVLLTAAALLVAGSSAFAADLTVRPMAVKAPPVTTAIPFSWTGCYIGASAGYQWGQSGQTARSGYDSGKALTNDYDLSGGIAGGTVGCNYEFSNNFVIGIEDDYSWTNKHGSANDLAPFNTKALNTTNEKWIDTLRGRVGYAFDRVMVYGTAGVAFAGTDINVNVPGFGNVTDSQTRTGWVAGVGAEWAVYTGPMGALTVKAEYLHADFGTDRYVSSPVTFKDGCYTQTVESRDVKLSDDMVRVGVNWKFNVDTVVSARY